MGFRSALDIATFNNNLAISELLRAAGANDRDSSCISSMDEPDLHTRYQTQSFDKSFQQSFYRKRTNKKCVE